MPTYDYACEKCGHEFPIRESIAAYERSSPECPECGSTELRRIYTPSFLKTARKS